MKKYVICIDDSRGVKGILIVGKKYEILEDQHSHFLVKSENNSIGVHPFFKWRFKDILILNKNITIL